MVTFITTYIFQFGFADTEQYWQPSWLFTLTFLRIDSKHIPLASDCRVFEKPCVVWFYVDAEVVFWFDVAHVLDHSQSYPAWSGGEQSNMCFEVPMKRYVMALVRAREEALDFERLQLRWQLRLTSGLRSAGMHRFLFPDTGTPFRDSPVISFRAICWFYCSCVHCRV